MKILIFIQSDKHTASCECTVSIPAFKRRWHLGDYCKSQPSTWHHTASANFISLNKLSAVRGITTKESRLNFRFFTERPLEMLLLDVNHTPDQFWPLASPTTCLSPFVFHFSFDVIGDVSICSLGQESSAHVHQFEHWINNNTDDFQSNFLISQCKNPNLSNISV